jgi:catechol 2,3-dioxygenase-like lactoylglutathione lyase family enzyme
LASEAVLQRIHMATVGTTQVAAHAALYARWLGYTPFEQGTVSTEQARSWGAPAMAGREYATLRSPGVECALLRLVQVAPAPDYRPLTRWGWNAIELLVRDPDALYARLQNSPFTHLGGPDFLAEGSSIRAVQFSGPAGEVFYFTRDTGDPARSTLAQARAAVDRPFIMVAAGGDLAAMRRVYADVLGAQEAFMATMPVPILAAAQGLPASEPFTLALLRLTAFSHSIELDVYPPPTGPRAYPADALPPGVAMASFIVDSLEGIDPQRLLAAPVQLPGNAYGGRRSAALRGAAGELIELLEQAGAADSGGDC